MDQARRHLIPLGRFAGSFSGCAVRKPPSELSQNSPQELLLDPILPINKHGSMVQKTAVVAKSAALPREGSGVRPRSANLCGLPQLSRGEVFRPHALFPYATLLPAPRRAT